VLQHIDLLQSAPGPAHVVATHGAAVGLWGPSALQDQGVATSSVMSRPGVQKGLHMAQLPSFSNQVVPGASQHFVCAQLSPAAEHCFGGPAMRNPSSLQLQGIGEDWSAGFGPGVQVSMHCDQ
jgi:hypothetical protein